MKYFLLLTFIVQSFNMSIKATKADLIVYEEYNDWMIYKKNETELLVAKQYRHYFQDPFFFALDATGKMYFNDKARKLWETLEEDYCEQEGDVVINPSV